MRRALADEPLRSTTIERTVELAEATEHIEPDLGRALALYLAAWRAGHVESRARVLSLARELRAYMTLAEVALADHESSKDPEALVTAGRAFFDAGLLERAVQTFTRATEIRAAVPEPACLADARTLLQLAKGYQTTDPERAIAGYLTRAENEHEQAASIYLQAARVARAARLEATYASVLHVAARRCPQDQEVARLVEDRLLARGLADEILEHYRQRFDATKGEAEWVACVRLSAGQLVLRNLHPGLGLRLLRRSLEHAYAASLPDVPRHLAAWELLVAHARTSRSAADLMPLIADALRAPLSADDAHYLSRLGLEIAWKDLGDPVAAEPYATAVRDREADHPLAIAFVTQFTPAPEPQPAEPVLPPEEPVRITFRIPVLKIEQPPEPPRDLPAVPVPAPAPSTPRPGASTASHLLARAARKVIPVDVVVELPSGSFFSSVLRDLSTSGAFIVTKRTIEVDTIVSLELHLPKSSALSFASYRIDARIARRTDLGWGLAFVRPPTDLVAAIAQLTGE
jgi:tetratricopeptide (TPR) repeat protein